jgi:uncharacterized membrane protein
LIASLIVGLAAGGVSGPLAAWQISVLVGWCAAAATFGGVAWSMMIGADSERTHALAAREDDSLVTADLVVLAASVASLVGVGLVLLKAKTAGGPALAGMTSLSVLSVLFAWAIVHTVFTLRYADLYYSDGGGIDFNEDAEPDYRDFAYLAFTVGMTYQVSDTNLQTKPIRRTALKHSLLSYLFGTAVIAVMINLVAGLAR